MVVVGTLKGKANFRNSHLLRRGTAKAPKIQRISQRVHVATLYILGAHRASHVRTLGPKHILYGYMATWSLLGWDLYRAFWTCI